jgi:hypothetical protein
MAGWQSGYAAACKAADAGSIPTLAFILRAETSALLTFAYFYFLHQIARVAELVDARDLKSL